MIHAAAIAMKGQAKLADRSTQSFTQVVDAIKNVKWYLPFASMEKTGKKTGVCRSSTWGAALLEAQDVSKTQTLMWKVVLNSRNIFHDLKCH